LLTTPEVAELLRVSPRTVDRWAIEGRLPRVQIARAVRYRADDIAALIDPVNESDGTVGTAPSLETSPAPGTSRHEPLY
jgi:excisionase family DNA binding protein